MKKTLKTFIFIFILAMILLPVFGNAQNIEGPNECCKLKHAINIPSLTPIGGYGEGAVIGSSEADAYCNLEGKLAEDDWPIICLIDTIMTITDWIFYIFMMVAVIMIIIGAFSFMFSAGDPTKAERGKKILIYSVIGIVIALLAKLVPSVIRFVIGM